MEFSDLLKEGPTVNALRSLVCAESALDGNWLIIAAFLLHKDAVKFKDSLPGAEALVVWSESEFA